MYEVLGISLALAGLLTLNAFVSFLAATLWRLIHRWARAWSATTRAHLLFSLRVIPSLVAIVIVVVLLIPAYITHEPRHQTEEFSLKIAVLASISAFGLLLALWRGLAAWIATRKLINNWLQNSEALNLPQIPVPVYRLNHPFPVIAVVGTFRPLLFIASHVLDCLKPEELDAAIRHECGHLAAKDNLKRAIFRACRDSLSIVPAGRFLDREWAAASEGAADEHAARKSNEVALDLAAALVKIARLVPSGVYPAMPASALLIGEDVGGIADRVKRLAQLASDNCRNDALPLVLPTSLWLSFGVLVATVLAIATNSQLLVTIHRMIEVAVSTLQ